MHPSLLFDRFLEECLGQDEQAAHDRSGVFPSAGVDDNGAVWLHIHRGGNAVIAVYPHPVEGYDDMHALRRWAGAEHGWTAERVLEETQAKQDIVRRHHRRRGPNWDYPGHIGFECGQCTNEYPCPTLRMLAQPYRKRLGYDVKWRP